MKHLINKLITKEVEFMGEKLVINKLSSATVFSLQNRNKDKTPEEIAKSDDDILANARLVIKGGVASASELTEEDFTKFPLDELNLLTEQIIKFSGLDNAKAAEVASGN